MDIKKNYIEMSKLAHDASLKALSVTGIGGPVQSLPLPIIDGGNLKIVFIYFPFHVSSQSVYPPRFKSIIDAASGELEEIKAVTPRDFGMAHKPNELLGHRKIIEGLTSDQIEQRRERLYHLYDLLLPEFAIGLATVSAESRSLAVEFKGLFSFFCPAQILPYCEATGREFFSWIDRIII